MAIDFPSSPTSGQQYQGYTYNSTIGAWQANSAAVAPSTVSANPPANPTVGDMWFNTNDGSQYFYYNDGNTSQWVESRAPITANGYYSPNYVINGGMDIWQRGTSSGWVNGFNSVDRWYLTSSISTTWAQDSSTTSPVNRFSLRGTAGASASDPYILQAIETINCIALAGKTVTLSAYISSSVATTFGLRLDWSASVDTSVTGSYSEVSTTFVSVSSTMRRYSASMTIPSNAKTLRINIGTSSLPANATFNITGVQLEEGSSATTFRRNANSLQGELAACQRYYYISGYAYSAYNIFNSGNCHTGSFYFPVTMRVSPTITVYDTGGNINKVSIANSGGVGQTNITPPASVQIDRTSFTYVAGGLGGTTGNVGMMMMNQFIASAEL